MYNIRSGTIRWQISTSIEGVLDNFSLDLTVFRYYFYIFPEILTWKIQIKITLLNIHNGAFRWQISTSTKVVLSIFASSHRVPDIIIYMFRNCMTLKLYVKVTMHNIRNGAILWQIHYFLPDGNSNAYSISHHLRDILRKIIKYQKC